MRIYGQVEMTMAKRSFKRCISAYFTGKSSSIGAILILFAVLMPVILMIAGMVSDIGRAFVMKAELNRACMIASEEMTKEIDLAAAQDNGSNTIDGNISDILEYFFDNNILQRKNYKINDLRYCIEGGGSNPRYISVFCEAEIECFMLKITGINTIKIHSSGNGRLKKLGN
jgi:hypothetical protein